MGDNPRVHHPDDSIYHWFLPSLRTQELHLSFRNHHSPHLRSRNSCWTLPEKDWLGWCPDSGVNRILKVGGVMHSASFCIKISCLRVMQNYLRTGRLVGQENKSGEGPQASGHRAV